MNGDRSMQMLTIIVGVACLVVVAAAFLLA